MKETELEVINHHLQGIMDCSDMMNLFCLLKMSRLYRQQHRRLGTLMSLFQYINKWYITKYQEIPQVSTTFQKLFTTATSESIATVINSWINWENKGIELYSQLLEETTDIHERRLWKKLLTTSKSCLQTAQICKQHYTPQSNAADTSVTNTTTNLRQRMQERLAATQK